MYMTGQISPYYFKNAPNDVFLHFLKVSFAIVPLYKYPCVKRAIFPYEKADIRRYPLLVFFNEPIPPEKFFFPFFSRVDFLSI